MDPTVPRLEAHHLELNGELIQACRRGDQAITHYLLANNDLENSVTVDINSKGRQAAVLPDGFTADDAYDSGIYSISNPDSGVDVFPAAFWEDLSPGELLALPDPFEVDVREISKSLTLLPGEAEIVTMVTRSYGMCLDGPCNERDFRVTGSFSNGDTALAYASSLGAAVGDTIFPQDGFDRIRTEFEVELIH